MTRSSDPTGWEKFRQHASCVRPKTFQKLLIDKLIFPAVMIGGKSRILRHARWLGHRLFRTQILFDTLQFGPQSTPREHLTNVIHWLKSWSWKELRLESPFMLFISLPLAPFLLQFICYTGVSPSASEQRINVDACCTGISWPSGFVGGSRNLVNIKIAASCGWRMDVHPLKYQKKK